MSIYPQESGDQREGGEKTETKQNSTLKMFLACVVCLILTAGEASEPSNKAKK